MIGLVWMAVILDEWIGLDGSHFGCANWFGWQSFWMNGLVWMALILDVLICLDGSHFG